MAVGTIQKLVSNKGFGFIEGERGEELFFHRSQLENGNFDSLTEGQRVEYNERQGPKGPRAENVRVL